MVSQEEPMRRERQLPERLRPLALLVDLANLLDHDEIKVFRSADRRLLEAQTEMFRINPIGANPADPALRALREQKIKAGDETRLILDNFAARAQKASNAEALALLQNNMKWAWKVNLNDKSGVFTVFRVVAAIREALEEVVLGLAVGGGNARLPVECYLPPAMLYTRDGLIKIGGAPISHWLLPMLDGLEAARLRLCEVCGKLFVARRRDQLGCSRRCGDAMYMRRYRRAEDRNGAKRTPSARNSAERRMGLLKKRS
jgi:hypothetical protein